MIKRIAALGMALCLGLCCAVMCVSAQPSSDTEVQAGDFICYGENDDFSLYVIDNGKRSGEFFIQNKADGCKYYSNPQDRDFSGEGLDETEEENSQFLLQIYSEESGAIRTLNSYKGSAKGKFFSVKEADEGADLFYTINGAIKITLKLRLTDRGFTVESDISKINNVKGNVIVNFKMLPYFSAACYGEDGYLFVPDGSGALMYNNTDKTTVGTYSQKVYGDDLAFASSVKTVNKENIYLPVFGAKVPGGGFLGIIEKGSENSTVNAESAMDKGMYNRAYCSFSVVGADRISLGEGVSGYTSVSETYDTKSPLTEKMKINYQFISEGQGYAQMATLYREYLGLKSVQPSETPSVFLELFGGLIRKESVWGIPLTVFKKMTTVAEAKEIARYFSKGGKSKPVISYRNADSALLSGKIQNKFRLKSGLGSKKQLKDFQKFCNGNLFLEQNLFSARKGGNGFSVFSGSAWRINHNNVMLNEFNLSTTNKDSDKPAYYAVKSTKLKKIYDKYFRSVAKAGFETAFVNLANTTYSDFDSDGYISRAATAATFTELVKQYGKNGLLYAPNGYALTAGKYTVDVPVSSSGYDAVDEDVPFYALVLSGTGEYSTESINLGANRNISFLKALECGASLKFTFVYDHITAIKNTSYEYLFGADYQSGKEEAKNQQNELISVYGQIGSRVMVDHRVLGEKLHLSLFENGNGLVTNYNNMPMKTPYGTVAAYGYLVVKGRE